MLIMIFFLCSAIDPLSHSLLQMWQLTFIAELLAAQRLHLVKYGLSNWDIFLVVLQ